jgi:hypothetical protein
MRLLAIFAITAAAFSLAAQATPAQAREYPWCARYDVWTMNCGFTTFQQCLATISGVGGICTPNPRAAVIGDERPRRHNRARADY